MSPLRRRLGAGLVTAAALALPPAGAMAAAGTTPRLGAHTMIETTMPPATVDALFAAARRAHLGSVRFDVLGNASFPLGPTDPQWQTLDVYRAAVRKHRLQAVGVIAGVPAWLSRCPQQAADFWRCPPTDYVAWSRLVQEIVARAPEIRFWEVVNEADLQHFFRGDAREYARFLVVTSAAVRAANLSAKVVFTGVVRPFDSPWLDTVLAEPGVIDSIDVANAHLRGGVDKLDEMVRAARGTFAYHGFHGPLWITEMGYASDPRWQSVPGYLSRDFATGRRTQARYMRRAVPILLRSGARRVFVTLRDLDTEWGPFTSEGLLHWPVTVPKPAYYAVSRIGERLIARAARRRHARCGCARARARPRRGPARRRGSARPASSASHGGR
jgi:hypothetical protein